MVFPRSPSVNVESTLTSSSSHLNGTCQGVLEASDASVTPPSPPRASHRDGHGGVAKAQSAAAVSACPVRRHPAGRPAADAGLPFVERRREPRQGSFICCSCGVCPAARQVRLQELLQIITLIKVTHHRLRPAEFDGTLGVGIHITVDKGWVWPLDEQSPVAGVIVASQRSSPQRIAPAYWLRPRSWMAMRRCSSPSAVGRRHPAACARSICQPASCALTSA